MDANPWPQGFQDIKLASPMEGVGGTNNSDNTGTTRPMLERKARPQEQLNCPRCNSTNTKFCYYNNYSLTQPRYFCKTCRRYWTEGGSLRNVPVGGGSRKNKRSTTSSSTSSSSSSSSSSTKLIPDINPPNISSFSSINISNPSHKNYQGQDLNLGFPVSFQESSAQGISNNYMEVTPSDQNNTHQLNLSSSSPLSALELLRTGIASRGLNSYIPTPIPDSNTLFSSGFPSQEVKPALGFNVDGLGSRFGVQENSGMMLFPFGEMKEMPNASEADQSKGQGSNSSGGYWNGMLGGGSW